MKKILALVLLGAIVFACKNDDDENAPVVRTVFKINIAADADLTDFNAWVIIRDSKNGSLLGYKPVVAGTTLTFTDTLQSKTAITGDKIDVAYFTVSSHASDGANYKEYYGAVYPGIDMGAEWNVKNANKKVTNPPQTGSYNLSISNMPSYYGVALSDINGVLQIRDYGYDFGGPIIVHTGVTKQMISVDPDGGKPKYAYITGIAPSKKQELNYSSFKDFDKYVSFEVPQEMYMSVKATAMESLPESPNGAFYLESGYQTYSNICWAQAFGDWGFFLKRKKVSLGFLNEFNIYKVSVDAGGFSYSSIGPAPSSITYIDPSQFKITNKTLADFSFTASRDYIRRKTAFSYGLVDETSDRINVELDYFSGTESAKLYQPVPDELIKKYSIPMDKITFAGTIFYTAGDSHADVLKRDKLDDSGWPWVAKAPFVETYVSVQ